MGYEITRVVKGKRGCGYRKPGGLYFRLDGSASGCDKLPIELSTCPCCGSGIAFSRSPQWITYQLLDVNSCSSSDCAGCPLVSVQQKKDEKLLLMWIGGKFYDSPKAFMEEGSKMGISRRIKSVPRGFVVGQTRIALAHLKAVPYTKEGDNKASYNPGVFAIFKPDRIEYVVKGDETVEQLQDMHDRGIQLVRVVKETSDLFEQVSSEEDE